MRAFYLPSYLLPRFLLPHLLFVLPLVHGHFSQAWAAPGTSTEGSIVGLGEDNFSVPYFPVGVSANAEKVTIATPFSIAQLNLSTGKRTELAAPEGCISLSVSATAPDASRVFGTCTLADGVRGFVTGSDGARLLSDDFPDAAPSACTLDGSRCLGVTLTTNAEMVAFEWTEEADIQLISFPRAGVSTIAGLSYDGSVSAGTTLAGEVFLLSSSGFTILAPEAESQGLSGDGQNVLLSIRESFLLERAYLSRAASEPEPLDPDFSFGRSTRATALSSDGSIVVGSYRFARGSERAFIWTANEGFYDLVAYVRPRENSPLRQWRLEHPSALSGDGTVIAGFGANEKGRPEGWIVRLGDWCGSGYTDDGSLDTSARDVFYQNWEAGLYSADLNRDGGVDGSDVDCFWRRASDNA